MLKAGTFSTAKCLSVAIYASAITGSLVTRRSEVYPKWLLRIYDAFVFLMTGLVMSAYSIIFFSTMKILWSDPQSGIITWSVIVSSFLGTIICVVTASYALYWARTGSLRRLFDAIDRLPTALTRGQTWKVVLFQILTLVFLLPYAINSLRNTVSQLFSMPIDQLFQLVSNVKLPNILLIIFEVFVGMVVCIATFLFSTICLIIHYHFINFNKNVMKCNTNQAVSRAVDDYFLLLSCVTELNQVFANWLFIVFILLMALAISLTFLVASYMKNPSMLANSVATIFAGLTTTLVQIAFTFWPAALLADDMLVIVDVIEPKSSYWPNTAGVDHDTKAHQATKEDVSMLLRVLTIRSSSLGVSLAGFLVVTRTYIINIMSTVFTYVILLVQFQQAEQPAKEMPVAFNGTINGSQEIRYQSTSLVLSCTTYLIVFNFVA